MLRDGTHAHSIVRSRPGKRHRDSLAVSGASGLCVAVREMISLIAHRSAINGHEQPFRHGFARTLKRQLQTETRRPFTNDEHSGVGLSWRSHSASPTFAKVCRRKSAPGRYRDPKGTEAKVCNLRVLCESGRAGGDSVANVTLHVIAKAVRSLGEALELAHAPMARKICRVFFHHIH